MCKCCCFKWFSKLFGAKKECCQNKHNDHKQATDNNPSSEVKTDTSSESK